MYADKNSEGTLIDIHTPYFALFDSFTRYNIARKHIKENSGVTNLMKLKEEEKKALMDLKEKKKSYAAALVQDTLKNPKK